MHLIFEAEGKTWPLRLTGEAQRTTAALLSGLPMPLQLHTPKIAGSHLYWHAPFVEDIESATDVLDAPTGAFLYWPVRQFLEITFAPLQAESAAVTVLGRLEAPLEDIARLAATVKRQQGRRTIGGMLRRANQGAPSPRDARHAPREIVAAREALWRERPADIAQLTASRGIMHPAGPVFMAESEARTLHELLWWIRAEIGKAEEAALRKAAALALGKAATRLRDFCHMTIVPGLLFRLESAMDEPAPLRDLIDEAILIVGRVGAWIDLLIPWDDVNEAFRAAIDSREPPLASAGAS